MARKTKPIWHCETPKGLVTVLKLGSEYVVRSGSFSGTESVERTYSTQTHIMALWKFREWMDEMLGQVIDEELNREAEAIR